jgi:Flp pilus assembly protein protease CpaA
MEALLSFQGHVTPMITITVVIAGMIILAALDVWRHEVEDYAIVALLVLATGGMLLEGITLTQWLGGILSAAIAFLVYLNLGMSGVMGGGDVKLSVVPAFVLGASSPLLGLWWIAGAVLVHQLLMLLLARRPRAALAGSMRPAAIALPHVPAMAGAMVIATVAFPVLL